MARIHEETKAQTQKRYDIMAYLDNQLEELEQIGSVVSVVTFNRNKKKISCYGHWIPDYALFAKLHPTIGKTTIIYPHFHQLTGWRTGHFVRLCEFEPRYDDDRWVALINFEITPFELAIPYPKLPKVAWR